MPTRSFATRQLQLLQEEREAEISEARYGRGGAAAPSLRSHQRG